MWSRVHSPRVALQGGSPTQGWLLGLVHPLGFCSYRSGGFTAATYCHPDAGAQLRHRGALVQRLASQGGNMEEAAQSQA